MVRFPTAFSSLACLVIAMASPFPALAQGLPGGASSLSETHSDWQVACELVEAKPMCAFLQTQLSSQNGQRVISIELQPANANGTVVGALVMPFGLALKDGVSAAVGTGNAISAQFSTCLPAGCIAEVSFDGNFVAGLKSGQTMDVVAKANGSGEDVKFSISLAGFSAALSRVAELTPRN